MILNNENFRSIQKLDEPEDDGDTIDFDEDEDDDEGEEGWMSSYSDLITDIMAVFVILYAFASAMTSNANAALKTENKEMVQQSQQLQQEILNMIEKINEIKEGATNKGTDGADGSDQGANGANGSQGSNSGNSGANDKNDGADGDRNGADGPSGPDNSANGPRGSNKGGETSEKGANSKDGTNNGAGSANDLSTREGVLNEVGEMMKNLLMMAGLDGADSDSQGKQAAEIKDKFDSIYELIKKKIAEGGYSNQIELKKGDGFYTFSFKDNLLFFPDSPKMREESFEIIEYIGDLLKSVDNSIQSIEISGHTADVGPDIDFFSWRLSSNRAITVLEFLVKNSELPESKMAISGYSSTKPVAENDTEQNRAKNRRVEMKIYRKNSTR